MASSASKGRRSNISAAAVQRSLTSHPTFGSSLGRYSLVIIDDPNPNPAVSGAGCGSKLRKNRNTAPLSQIDASPE
jgi:hypothetical protein